MILGIGTDLAEVERLRESIARFGDRFLNRIYTAGERAYSASKANPVERLAARFAAPLSTSVGRPDSSFTTAKSCHLTP